MTRADSYLRQSANENSNWIYSQRASFAGSSAARYSLTQGQLQLLAQSAVGGMWVPMGPSPIQSCQYGSGAMCSGRVTAIAPDAIHPGTIYLGGAQGGVWKSTDGGAHWAPLTDNQPSLATGSITIDPNDVIYVGTGEGNESCDSYYGAGVLKSTDGGSTWAQLGASTFGASAISRIAVNPTSTSAIIASAIEAHYTDSHYGFCNGAGTAAGVYVSTNSGVSWTRTLSATFGSTDLVMDPTTPAIIYAAADGGVYKSSNNGTTWSGPIGGGLPAPSLFNRIGFAISASSHLTVLAAVHNNTSGEAQLWKSTDGGSSWLIFPTPTGIYGPPHSWCYPQCWYNLVVAVDPTDPNTVYLGGLDLYRTTDGGTTWTDLGGYAGYLHPDQHAIAFLPTSHTTIFSGNDGGIWVSPNANTCTPISCWTNLNQGLGLTQFVSISTHPTDPNVLFGGTQDNGSNERNATSWNMLVGGDGGWTGIDRNNPLTMYHAFQYITPQRSDDGGKNWHAITNGLNPGDTNIFYDPMAMDPTTPTTLYFGTYRLYKTTTRGDAWFLPSPGLTLSNDVINGVAVAPSNGQYVYVVSIFSKFYVSTDGGSTFVERDTGLPPSQFPTSVAVDPGNPQRVAVTFTGLGFGGKHVFMTSNAGVSWIDTTVNLPDIPANSVTIDPAGNVFIGDDMGVFVLLKGGASWLVLGTGLPHVATFGLVFSANGTLIAATHGRSTWALSFDFSLSNGGSRTVAKGQSVTNQINVTMNGPSTSQVSLSCSGLPAGTACTFSPAAGYPSYTSTMTISTSKNTPPGTYTITVTGTGGGRTHMTQFTLTVTRH